MGERSIDVIVSTRADLVIERLGRRYRISRRDVIERLMLAADEHIVARMDIDSDDWAYYFGVPAIQP